MADKVTEVVVEEDMSEGLDDDHVDDGDVDEADEHFAARSPSFAHAAAAPPSVVGDAPLFSTRGRASRSAVGKQHQQQAHTVEAQRLRRVTDDEPEHGNTAAAGDTLPIEHTDDSLQVPSVGNRLTVPHVLQMGTTRRRQDDYIHEDLHVDPATLEWLPGAVLYSPRVVEGANAAIMMMACAPSTPDRISVVRPMRLPAGLNRSTFLVDLSTLKHWKDVLVDDYGSWGVQSGGAAVHYYVDVVQLTAKNVSNRKMGVPNSLYNWLLRPVYTTHPCSAGRFKRRIFLGRPADLVEWRWAVLCYEWIGAGHPNDMQLRPHGNARKNLMPYQPTQTSTRQALREIAMRRRPTVAFVEAHMRLAEDGADGCFAAESPRNLVQIQNYRRATRPSRGRRKGYGYGDKRRDEAAMRQMERGLEDSMMNMDDDLEEDDEMGRMARRWQRRSVRADPADGSLYSRLTGLPTLTEIFGCDEDEMYARALAVSLRRMTPANRHWIKVQFRRLISEVSLAEQGVDPALVDADAPPQLFDPAELHAPHADEPILAASPEPEADELADGSAPCTSSQSMVEAEQEAPPQHDDGVGGDTAGLLHGEHADVFGAQPQASTSDSASRANKRPADAVSDSDHGAAEPKRSKRLRQKAM